RSKVVLRQVAEEVQPGAATQPSGVPPPGYRLSPNRTIRVGQLNFKLDRFFRHTHCIRPIDALPCSLHTVSLCSTFNIPGGRMPTPKPHKTPESPLGEFLLYQTEDGRTRLDIRLAGQTLWLTQAQMAELFQTSTQNVTLHLKGIYEEGELTEEAT